MADEEARYGYYDQDGYHDCDENDEKATVVEISVKAYHGLKIAKEIVKRRACQQVKESNVDENGYKFLMAEKSYCKKMENRTNGQGNKIYWKITKLTPYSLEVPLNDVKKLIMDDLENYYNYTENITVLELLADDERDRKRKTTRSETARFPADNAWVDKYKEALDWLEERNFKIVFDLIKVRLNYQIGLYEITYWASDLI